MSDTLKFPPGSAISFTTGEYSDFSTRGTLITLIETDLPLCAQRYVAECRARPENAEGIAEGYYSDDLSGFVAWLVVNGFAMAAAVQEVHLGSYGEFEGEFGVARP